MFTLCASYLRGNQLISEATVKGVSFWLILFFLASLVSGIILSGCGDDDNDDSGDVAKDDDAADDDDTVDDDTSAADDDATDDDLDSRSFYLSAAPYQYEMGDDYIKDRFEVEGFDGRIDLLSVHQDFFGIPWSEFAAGQTPPAVWIAKMQEIQIMADELGVDVFLSLTPLDSTRETLTPQAVEEGGELVLDEDWYTGCFAFNDAPEADEIRNAYKNYVRWMVDLFDPPFLNIGIEMDMYRMSCPDDFNSLIELLNEVYTQEKALDPERVIFSSWEVEIMYGYYENGPCPVGDLSCLNESLELYDSLLRDRIGLSHYPLPMIQYEPGGLPEDLYTLIHDLTGETVVFAEIGLNNKPTILPYPTLDDPCVELLTTDDQMQSDFVQTLFTQADEMDSALVCWWSVRDYLPSSVLDHCPCQAPGLWCLLYESVYDYGLLAAWLMWGSMGMIDYEMNPKPALNVWMDWLARPVE